ncbi:hypothetical protein [Vreelandella sp. EE7]
MDPKKIVLCWPNHVNEATASGGGWEQQLPLAQVLDRTPSELARSMDLTPANTQMWLTIKRYRPIGVVALYAHNLSASARWRVSVYFEEASGEPAWQSEWVRVWPAVYATSELEWEYDNFWGGELDEDDRDSFTPLAKMFLPTIRVARTVHIEINDPGNPVGYVSVGRVFISDVWQPEYNMSFGGKWGFDDGTTVEEAGDPNRTEFFDIKTPKRTLTFSLDHLTEQEGFRRMLAMQRKLGTHGEVLFAESIEDTPESFSKTFIGRLTALNPLDHPHVASYTNAPSLMEII